MLMDLNWLDWAIIAVLVLSSLISLIRGFVKEAISLAIWFMAFLISSQFYLDLAHYFTTFEQPMVRNGVAITVLFVSTLIVGGLVNMLVAKLVQFTGLSGTDRVLGILFGALRGILIVSAILFFADIFTPVADSKAWQSSLLVPEFKLIISWFYDYIQNASSFITAFNKV